MLATILTNRSKSTARKMVVAAAMIPEHLISAQQQKVKHAQNAKMFVTV
jgi:hypothetical protein